MLKQVTQKKIKENWEFYKEQIKVAFLSSEGGQIFSDNSSEQVLREIYGRLRIHLITPCTYGLKEKTIILQ